MARCHGLPTALTAAGKIAAFRWNSGVSGDAVDQADRSHKLVEMALGTESYLSLIGELHIFDRADSRTGFKSNIPLPATPPLIIVGGMPKSFCQSVVSSTPTQWPPEEWPLI